VIDWLFVARHAVWIAGAAAVTAALSWNRGGVVTPYALAGAAAFCVGLAAVSRWWMAILWVAAACVPVHRWTKQRS